MITRLRVQFAKRGKAAFLSHFELSSAIVRAITVSGFSFSFSDGFHPHPKISFPYALPVGVESLCEYVDIQLRGYRGSADAFARRVNQCLPAGFVITGAERLPPYAQSLATLITGFEYRMYLPDPPLPDITEKIHTFLASDTFPVTRHKKGAVTVRDIRPLVTSLSLDAREAILSASTRFDPSGGVKPLEILTRILGYDETTAQGALIVKTRIIREEATKGQERQRHVRAI